MQFLAVDSDIGTNVAVTYDGQILTYDNPVLPVSCIDDHGVDWLQSVNSADSQYYLSENGSYLDLSFIITDVSVAKLILADPSHEKSSIHVQIKDQTGTWFTIADIVPRIFGSTEIIDLTSYLPQLGSQIQIRLYFTAQHELDFIGLDTSPQENFILHNGRLILAFHSNDGLVTRKLATNDGNYAELTPDQQILLFYLLPTVGQNMKRTYIYVTRGRYHTITSQNP